MVSEPVLRPQVLKILHLATYQIGSQTHLLSSEVGILEANKGFSRPTYKITTFCDN